MEGLKTSDCCVSTSLDVDNDNCVPTTCEAGHYCPPASTSATQNECGNGGTEPQLFCPEGSALPLSASAGHYTIGSLSNAGSYQVVGDVNRRSAEVSSEPGTYSVGGVRRPCPAGRFGETAGLTTAACSGPCAPGHYCEEESVSGLQNRCGHPGLYCPSNSSAPMQVTTGYMSHDGGPDTRANQTVCPKGSYCPLGTGVAHLCPAGRYGSDVLLVEKKCTGACAPGYYCPEGSTTSTQVVCPAGRYSGHGAGSSDCEGSCARGHYCPEGSTNMWEYECGGEFVYCPGGVGEPRNVTVGWYSTGGDNSTTRTAEVECEAFGRDGIVDEMDLKILGACPTTTRMAGEEVRGGVVWEGVWEGGSRQRVPHKHPPREC